MLKKKLNDDKRCQIEILQLKMLKLIKTLTFLFKILGFFRFFFPKLSNLKFFQVIAILNLYKIIFSEKSQMHKGVNLVK